LSSVNKINQLQISVKLPKTASFHTRQGCPDPKFSELTLASTFGTVLPDQGSILQIFILAENFTYGQIFILKFWTNFNQKTPETKSPEYYKQ
jgi:hypothetical protein